MTRSRPGASPEAVDRSKTSSAVTTRSLVGVAAVRQFRSLNADLGRNTLSVAAPSAARSARTPRVYARACATEHRRTDLQPRRHAAPDGRLRARAGQRRLRAGDRRRRLRGWDLGIPAGPERGAGIPQPDAARAGRELESGDLAEPRPLRVHPPGR